MHFRRNILTGLLTVVPLALTAWVIVSVARLLAAIGEPGIEALARWIEPDHPALAARIAQPEIQFVSAIILVLIGLYAIGAIAADAFGRRFLAWFDRLFARLPVIEIVYSSARKLVKSLQDRSASGQAVVLINFPSSELKTIGLLTRTFTDIHTGREIAAVFVPTAPNPTTGYVELVPLEHLVRLDWTANEAMAFVISGGVVAPDQIDYGFKPPARTE